MLSQKILECVAVEMEQEQECPFLFCSECDRSFDKVHLLVGHIQHHHPSSSDTQGHSQIQPVDNNGVIIIAEKTGEKPSVEKPFQCETCGKRFCQSGQRRTHIRKFHPEVDPNTSTENIVLNLDNAEVDPDNIVFEMEENVLGASGNEPLIADPLL